MFPTIIYQHKKENLKKCTLHWLKGKEGFRFFTYPKDSLPDLSNYLILIPEAFEILSPKDLERPLFIIDGTWNLARRMTTFLTTSYPTLLFRSLPKHFKTAYPRRQTGCLNPEQGLASIEALYLAFLIQGKEMPELLDHYYWKKTFLFNNGLG